MSRVHTNCSSVTIAYAHQKQSEQGIGDGEFKYYNITYNNTPNGQTNQGKHDWKGTLNYEGSTVCTFQMYSSLSKPDFHPFLNLNQMWCIT